MILVLMIAFCIGCLYLAAQEKVEQLITEETRRLDIEESERERNEKLCRSVD